MRLFFVFVAIAAVLAFSPVRAEEPAEPQAVRIEADQAAKAFIFIIDGQPVAMLNKAGLHVVEGIEYGRSIADTGPEQIEKAIASRMKEVAHE